MIPPLSGKMTSTGSARIRRCKWFMAEASGRSHDGSRQLPSGALKKSQVENKTSLRTAFRDCRIGAQVSQFDVSNRSGIDRSKLRAYDETMLLLKVVLMDNFTAIHDGLMAHALAGKLSSDSFLWDWL
jgi:hypothetical protein